MTTTTRTSASATSVFARGSNKAAVTQLTGCSVTRSGTTATLSKTSHGRSNGDKVWIRGFNLEEFNGVFTVANAAANTFDYTIKQDPGANPSGSPGTVDVVDVSASLNNSTGFGAMLVVQIQNTTTGPTVAPSVLIGYADADNEYDYFWEEASIGQTVASLGTAMRFEIPSHARYWKVALGGNTGQAVDYYATAYTTPSLATS